MLLTYFNRVQIVGRLSTDGEVDLITVDRMDWGAVSSSFVIANGLLIALYRSGDELRLRVGREETSMQDAVVVRTVVGERVKMSVTPASGERLTWEYTLPIIDPPLSMDPTPGIEEEHFDFGLHLEILSKDPARMKRVWNASGPNHEGTGRAP